MKSKYMGGGLRLADLLLIVGITTSLLALVPPQMVSASVVGSNTSNSNQEAINHIGQAQSALENGDTEGAQMHLDLAKQALGCSPIDPRC